MKVVITQRILQDFFFSAEPARLWRFCQHWTRAIESGSSTYFPYPEDDNEKTYDLAYQLNWIGRATQTEWYLTGPDRNHLWLRSRRGESGASTYVIEAIGQGLVKIGKSRNPWARLAALQTSNPRELAMVVVFERDVEAMLHARHATDRVTGEWFRYSPAIRETVAALEKGRL